MITLLILAIGIFGWFELVNRRFIQNMKNDNYDDKISRELAGYVRSIIHATVVTLMTTIGLYWLREISSENIFTSRSDIYVCMSIMSIAYFLHDIIHLQLGNNSQKTIYTIHHLCFSAFLLWTVIFDTCHYGGLVLYLAESGTVILNMFQYFKFYAKLYGGRIINHTKKADKKKMEHYNNLSYFTFLVFTYIFVQTRLVNMTMLLINHYNHIIFSPVPILIMGFVLYLNGRWLISIVNMIRYFKPIEYNHDALKKDC